MAGGLARLAAPPYSSSNGPAKWAPVVSSLIPPGVLPDPQAGPAALPHGSHLCRPSRLAWSPSHHALHSSGPAAWCLAQSRSSSARREDRRGSRHRHTGQPWAGRVGRSSPGSTWELTHERKTRPAPLRARPPCVGKSTVTVQTGWWAWHIHPPVRPLQATVLTGAQPNSPTVLPSILPRFLSAGPTAMPAFFQACPAGHSTLQKPPPPQGCVRASAALGPRRRPLPTSSGLQPVCRHPTSGRLLCLPASRLAQKLPAEALLPANRTHTCHRQTPHGNGSRHRASLLSFPERKLVSGLSCCSTELRAGMRMCALLSRATPCSGVSSEVGRSQAPPGS